MHFDWDEANLVHLANHDVAPEEAEEAFQNDPIDLEVEEHDVDGHHYRQLGETDRGRILVFMSTVRGEAVHIFTAWDAPKAFKEFYLRQRASAYGKE